MNVPHSVCLLAIALSVAASIACNGGDGDAGTTLTPEASRTARVASATTTAASGTAPAATGTPPVDGANLISGRAPALGPSPTPRPTGQPIAFSPGRTLLESDLVARGQGPGGGGAFNIARVIISVIGVDAAVTSAVVGADGQMPGPPSLHVAVWYDFSQWPGLGGLPNAGGNVVMAGDALKEGGSGVFTQLPRIALGTQVRLLLTDGSSACYRIEFNKIAADEQTSMLVEATAEESITLITGAGADTRAVLWGRRAMCVADEPPPLPTPTRAPRTGHHKLRLVAESNTYTVVEGGTVPLGVHTVDWSIDHRDAGVAHTFDVYDAGGKLIFDTEPLVGPANPWQGPFGVGPPQPAGQYTLRCSIHPSMTATITVLP